MALVPLIADKGGNNGVRNASGRSRRAMPTARCIDTNQSERKTSGRGRGLGGGGGGSFK